MALTEAEELELLELEEQESFGTQAMPPNQDPSSTIPVADIAGEAFQAATTGPAQATQKFFETDPGTMQRVGGAALPIAGGALGGPIGAAVGEFARQATGTVFAPETVPNTPLAAGLQVVGAGVAQNPAIVPGFTPVANAVGKGLSKAGKGLARIAQSFTGTKAEDFAQAAKQGISTYAAPSMDEAQDIFGQALAKQGVEAKPTLQAALDPQLRVARKTAMDVGKLLEAGEAVTPEQALRARQGVDRIIAATPFKDKQTLTALKDLRNQFDDALGSGPIKDASTTYREAIVKRNVTRPLRVNKSGEQSATVPILGAVAGSLTGFGTRDAGTGVGTALGAAAATSPLLWGLAATGAGSVAGGIARTASSPAVRQVVLEYLARKNRRGETQ